MAVTPESGTSLNGLFKTVYADKLADLVPSWAEAQKRIRFLKDKKQGGGYQQTVKVARGYGDTYAASTTALTAFALNDAVAQTLLPATVTGTSFTRRTQVPYTIVMRSDTGEYAAFEPAMDLIVADMAEGAANALEMCLLYGGSSLATISSVAGSSTTRTWTITTATWSPGIWVQGTNMLLDVYDTVGGTKINTNTYVTVTSVDNDNRTISVSGNATDLTNILATHVIVPVGASGNWFSGMDAIATNTGSLFGINATTYNLWKANTYSAGTAGLTLAKLGQAAAKTAVRSGMRDLVAFVSPYTWQDLNNDAAALRRLEPSEEKLKFGAKAITYYGPSGSIEVVPHPMIKAGEAFLFDPKTFVRIGSSETTFRIGGTGDNNDNFIQHLPNNDGFEIRCKWDQATLCIEPASLTKVTGIVNTVA